MINNEELWSIFTRKEEYSSSNLDRHKRFNHNGSMNGVIERPIVSQYLKEKGYSMEYPEGKSFAVCLTHDVDDIFPPNSHIIASSLHCLSRFKIKKAFRQLSWKLTPSSQSPYLNIKGILDLELKYGATSTFFFLTGSEDILRHRYYLDDVESQIGEIINCGGEVGLHGGYYSFDSYEALSSEKKEIEKRVGNRISGYRGHYLRFKVPETWILLSKLGFKYDTTLGYPDAIGFRNGMCFPFRPYDLRCNIYLDIIEIPMAVMDSALFKNERTSEGAFLRVKSMIDIVESYNGVLVLNWHSNNLLCPFRESWLKTYGKILEYCIKKNAWITNGIEIIQNCSNLKF